MEHMWNMLHSVVAGVGGPVQFKGVWQMLGDSHKAKGVSCGSHKAMDNLHKAKDGSHKTENIQINTYLVSFEEKELQTTR